MYRRKGGGLVAEPVGATTRFSTLYDQHRFALHSYCRRRVASDAVDDVMSDVFLTAWRRMDAVPEGAELPWLYGVARHVISNQRRSLGRRSRLAGRVVALRAVDDEGPDERAASGDDRVLRALASLPDTDQELLRLRAWEDLSSAEIAIVLGIRPSAVDMRLSRARRRLEQALGMAETMTSDTAPRVALNEESR
jgi:RNA polymerase sigma-70 factor (ECF subfamily)